MRGVDPGGAEALRGCSLKEHRHQRQLWVYHAQSREHHRFDGAAHGDQSGLWRVLQRSVESVATAACSVHPGAKAEMVQEFPPVPSGPSRLRS